MGRCLIIANHALSGAKLDNLIRDRLGRHDSQFFIVVPVVEPKYEASTSSLAFPFDGIPPVPPVDVFEEEQQRRNVALDEAHQMAERRLVRMIDRVRSAGGEVAGEVGDADPTVAVRAVLARDSIDEIVISVRRSQVSRWLRLDLPNRISRMTKLPVTTIEAEEAHTNACSEDTS